MTNSLKTLQKLARLRLDEKRKIMNDLQAQQEALAAQINTLELTYQNEMALLEVHPEFGFAFAEYQQQYKAQKLNLFQQEQKLKRHISQLQRDIMALYQDAKRYEIADDRRRDKAENEENRKLEQAQEDLVAGRWSNEETN